MDSGLSPCTSSTWSPKTMNEMNNEDGSNDKNRYERAYSRYVDDCERDHRNGKKAVSFAVWLQGIYSHCQPIPPFHQYCDTPSPVHTRSSRTSSPPINTSVKRALPFSVAARDLNLSSSSSSSSSVSSSLSVPSLSSVPSSITGSSSLSSSSMIGSLQQSGSGSGGIGSNGQINTSSSCSTGALTSSTPSSSLLSSSGPVSLMPEISGSSSISSVSSVLSVSSLLLSNRDRGVSTTIT
jgi:hypothetical protein